MGRNIRRGSIGGARSARLLPFRLAFALALAVAHFFSCREGNGKGRARASSRVKECYARSRVRMRAPMKVPFAAPFLSGDPRATALLADGFARPEAWREEARARRSQRVAPELLA